jgi:hypothetical protein
MLSEKNHTKASGKAALEQHGSTLQCQQKLKAVSWFQGLIHCSCMEFGQSCYKFNLHRDKMTFFCTIPY